MSRRSSCPSNSSLARTRRWTGVKRSCCLAGNAKKCNFSSCACATLVEPSRWPSPHKLKSAFCMRTCWPSSILAEFLAGSVTTISALLSKLNQPGSAGARVTKSKPLSGFAATTCSSRTSVHRASPARTRKEGSSRGSVTPGGNSWFRFPMPLPLLTSTGSCWCGR